MVGRAKWSDWSRGSSWRRKGVDRSARLQQVVASRGGVVGVARDEVGPWLGFFIDNSVILVALSASNAKFLRPRSVTAFVGLSDNESIVS